MDRACPQRAQSAVTLRTPLVPVWLRNGSRPLIKGSARRAWPSWPARSNSREERHDPDRLLDDARACGP